MKNNKKRRFSLKGSFPFAWRDCLVTLAIMGCGCAVCVGLRFVSETDFHVPLIFVLVVLVVSLFTDGYLFGLSASVVSVFAVNYVFTYPYFHFNFYMTGYPLTFLCMFVVSVITCTLMSRVRKSEQMRLDAEREKMRANLLRAISHDFRTPLTSIIGTLGVLSDNDKLLSDADRRTLLLDAKGDAEWLVNIMENILSITRFSSGDAPRLHTELQAAEEVISEAVGRFRKQYPGLKVDIHIPDELLIVPMDAMLIEQVIINLLVNIVLHSGGAELCRFSVERAGDMAHFTVEDNGKGISRSAMEHLFDGRLMHGGEQVREDSRRTMGIGLSVCRTIIRAHGGTLNAHNRPEGGAVFTFTLPLAEEDRNGDTFQGIDS